MPLRRSLQVPPFVSFRLQHILFLFAFLLQLVALNFYRGYTDTRSSDASALLSPSLPTATPHSFYLYEYSSGTETIDHNNTICSPSSPGEILRSTSTTSGSSGHLPPKTIYLEFAWTNMHSEIFYSLIREFCGTFVKDVVFFADENVAFYLGPPHRITPPALDIWREFNESEGACGPIYIDTPIAHSPDLTVLTTTYAHPTFTREFIARHVNNSKFLIVCHDDNPEMEDATNVFWLTPLHSNYFIPNFFPPSFVARRKQQSWKRREEAKSAGPVFLVLGKATPRWEICHRNEDSLVSWPFLYSTCLCRDLAANILFLIYFIHVVLTSVPCMYMHLIFSSAKEAKYSVTGRGHTSLSARELSNPNNGYDRKREWILPYLGTCIGGIWTSSHHPILFYHSYSFGRRENAPSTFQQK